MTDKSSETLSTGDRLLHLDGLRGCAIAMVIVHHFVPPLLGSVPASPGAYLAAAITLGYTGVDLFFVLSGYLIGGILIDQRESPRLFMTFFARRTARILPLAFLCIAAILGTQAIGAYGEPEGGPPWPLGVYILFATNLWMAGVGDWGYRPLSQLWSLGIEEQFYLVSPWLIRAVRPTNVVWMLLGIVVLAPLSRLGILAWKSDAALAAGMLPFCRMDSIGLGMLSACLMRHSCARQWCIRHSRALMLICALLAISCAVLTKLRAGNGSFEMAAGGYTVTSAFYASLLLLTETTRESGLTRTLSAGPLVLLGRYSYFLYLFQGLVIGLTVGLVFHGKFAVVTPANWLQLFAGLVSLLMVAHASSRWFEQPLLALGRRLSY